MSDCEVSIPGKDEMVDMLYFMEVVHNDVTVELLPIRLRVHHQMI